VKKLLVLVVLLVVAVSAMPAAAVPVDELTELAAYYPADTAVFFTLRTDTAYIETIDGLIGRIVDAVPGVPPVSLTQELDRMSQEASGGSFEEVFGPWLGDKAAFGFTDLAATADNDRENDITAFLLTVEITNRAAAVEYLNTVAEDRYEVTEGSDYTVFLPVEADSDLESLPPVAVGDDVIFLGGIEAAMAGMPDPALSGSDAFAAGLDSLPGDDYNILGFVNAEAITEFAETEIPADSPDAASLASLQTLGPVAFGFTLVDGRSLTADVAVALDLEMLSEMTGVADYAMTPIDMSFADYIPAGTPLVVISSNLSATYENALTSLESLAAMQGEEAQDELEKGLQQITFALRGLTGLDLEEDILSWMTGEYALYLGLTPAVEEADNLFAALADGLPVNFGLLVDASADPEAAAGVVDGIAQAIDFAATQSGEATEIETSDETIGGTDALVITITDRGLPFPIELLVASNEEVFVFGTRGAVQAALAPDGSLSSDAAFQEALGYALPDASAFLYLAGEGLQPLANLAATAGGPEAEEQAEVLRSVFGLLSSSSASSTMGADGMQVQRWVITLPE
jgi:hypothetical protein